MLYMILSQDKADALPLRRATRPAHLAYIQPLIDEQRLLLAGPRPKVDSAEPGDAGFYGSLIIAEFADLAAAKAWADNDPYARAGVFSDVCVQPLIKSLP